MTKQQELEARMNVRTFDGHLARVDANSAGEWYIHRDVRCAQRKEYLTRKGTWESSSTDRWPTMEAAIGFARFGPVKVATEHAELSLNELVAAAEEKYAGHVRRILAEFMEAAEGQRPKYVDGLVVRHEDEIDGG